MKTTEKEAINTQIAELTTKVNETISKGEAVLAKYEEVKDANTRYLDRGTTKQWCFNVKLYGKKQSIPDADTIKDLLIEQYPDLELSIIDEVVKECTPKTLSQLYYEWLDHEKEYAYDWFCLCAFNKEDEGYKKLLNLVDYTHKRNKKGELYRSCEVGFYGRQGGWLSVKLDDRERVVKDLYCCLDALRKWLNQTDEEPLELRYSDVKEVIEDITVIESFLTDFNWLKDTVKDMIDGLDFHDHLINFSFVESLIDDLKEKHLTKSKIDRLKELANELGYTVVKTSNLNF